MKKEQFLKLGFTDEMAYKAMDILREELKGYIPKSRFDQVNEVKKDLEKRLSSLEARIEEADSIMFTHQELEKILQDFWRNSSALKTEQEEMMKDVLIRIAFRTKVVNTGYADLLTGKLDKSKLTVASDGTLTGIEEQLAEMQKVYEGMFRI
jgi:hypothetical protein